VLVADSSYTTSEYPAKLGWGHGTFESCMQMAESAGVQQLYLPHHEPTRNDEALETVFNEALGQRKFDIGEIDLAREGLEIEW